MRAADAAMLLSSLNHSHFPFADNDRGCFAAAPPASPPAAGRQPELDASPPSHPAVLAAVADDAAARFSVAPTGTAGGCSDGGPGSPQQPFCSVLGGVLACRRVLASLAASDTAPSCAVVLANGTHRLNATVALTAADSGLAIVGGGPGATVSGAALLASGSAGWQRLRSLPNGTALWRLAVPDYGPARVISDCHFPVQLNHFIPVFLSYSVAVFIK
jgi:hypothetical protein